MAYMVLRSRLTVGRCRIYQSYIFWTIASHIPVGSFTGTLNPSPKAASVANPYPDILQNLHKPTHFNTLLRTASKSTELNVEYRSPSEALHLCLPLGKDASDALNRIV